MFLIDPKLLELMEKSVCYGVAHDPKAKECKDCDVRQNCAAMSASNRTFKNLKKLNPKTQKVMEEVKQKASTQKKEKKPNPSGNLPDLKGKSEEELWEILKERGGSCKKYGNPNIQKMRLIMAIKATYK